MTDKLFNKELLIKYFQGETSDSENEKILKWLKSDKSNISVYNELKSTWEIFGKQEISTNNETDWNSLKNKMIASPTKEKNSKKIFLVFARYAAAILIGFVLFFTYDYFRNIQQNEFANTGFNEIIVPKGEKSQIILSDGTKVWLNSGSKLKYPNAFNLNERNVYLEGEAYFDVVKQQKQKFIVHTESINIKVLGTKFNVKSYPEDDLIETTLISGSVLIENEKDEELALLMPNQTAIFSKIEGDLAFKETIKKEQDDKLLTQPLKKKAIQITEVNTENIVSWKDELLVFNNESLDKMAIKLERWFGMKIIIENKELKNYQYRGRFEDNTTIYEVLEIIKLTTPICYKVSKTEIRIDLANEKNKNECE